MIPIASAATRQRAAKLESGEEMWTSFFSDDCNTPYFPLPQLAPAQLGNGKGHRMRTCVAWVGGERAPPTRPRTRYPVRAAHGAGRLVAGNIAILET